MLQMKVTVIAEDTQRHARREEALTQVSTRMAAC